MQDLSPTINRNSNIIGHGPDQIITAQSRVEQNIDQHLLAQDDKQELVGLNGPLYVQYDSERPQEKLSSDQIEQQINQPATSRQQSQDLDDDQQQQDEMELSANNKIIMMNKSDGVMTDQQPISIEEDQSNGPEQQADAADEDSSVQSIQELPQQANNDDDSCQQQQQMNTEMSAAVVIAQNLETSMPPAEQSQQNDDQEKPSSKEQSDQGPIANQEKQSSSSGKNGASNPLVQNQQNCISSLQECLNEIMQKPRKDSTGDNVAKHNINTNNSQRESQLIAEEGAVVIREKGGQPSEGGLAGRDTAVADDSSKGQGKKRMRKRLDKHGQQMVADDQSESMYNNLKRAETKIYQEDKVRNEIECDINNAMYKNNNLSLQKFQTQFTSTKVRGATRVNNQNFAEDFAGFTDGKSILEKQDLKSVVNQGQVVHHQHRMGRWTKDEHFRFLVALKLYGKEWRKVQEHVITRTSTQARSHAQKFFQKLEKRSQNLEEFLEALDVDNLEKHCIMSDLEDEGVPTGPRTKNKSKQRQGNRNNRNSTLLIPDVVPLKNRQQQLQQAPNVNDMESASKQGQLNTINQPQERNISDNAPSSPDIRHKFEHNQVRPKQDHGGSLEQETMKLVIHDDQSSPNEMAGGQENKSPSMNVKGADNEEQSSSSNNRKEFDYNSAQKSQSPQIPHEGQNSQFRQGAKQLLAKRSNPQSAEQNIEFQLPLPKKSYQPTDNKSSKNESYIASDEKQANKQNMRSHHFEVQRRQAQFNQQSHSPNLQTHHPPLETNYSKPLDPIQSNSYNQIGQSNKPNDVRASGIFALGPVHGGFGATRQHSNSISLGTTRPQSSLIPHQKMNSNMVGNTQGGMQNNSQISAMTGVQNNINNQYPMTPNLRHSAASVMNHPMTGSVLDLQGQNYSILSQMSNAQYQQIKQGKDRPRANSFDEQFFNNILDKDDEIDEIDENQILPRIHTALVSRMVQDQIPIPGSGVEAPYIQDNETLQQTHNRLNLTPKPKYPQIYSMMTAPPHSSAACQNTLGFDDGLHRMRSNMRRVDSAEQFALDNNIAGRADDPMKMDPANKDPNGMLNEHLISGADMGGVQIPPQQPGVDMQALQSALSRQLPSSFLLQQGGNSVLDINPGISSLLQQNQMASADLMGSLMQSNQQRQAAAAAAALIDPTGLQKQIMQLQQASSQQQVTAALMDQAAIASHQQSQGNSMLHQHQLRALDLHQMQIKQVVNANLAVQQQQLAAAAAVGLSAHHHHQMQGGSNTGGFHPDTIAAVGEHMGIQSATSQVQQQNNNNNSGGGHGSSQNTLYANYQKQQQHQQQQQQLVMMKQMEQQQQNAERWKQQQQHQQQPKQQVVDLTSGPGTDSKDQDQQYQPQEAGNNISNSNDRPMMHPSQQPLQQNQLQTIQSQSQQPIVDAKQ